jgi:iron complex transport system substrate-binding protein
MRRCWPALLLFGCAGQPVSDSAIGPGGIISNNPCIDAVLERIAAPAQIAAVSHYSHDPASASASTAWARQFPGLGASAEEILAARPRLLLTGNLASSGTNAALDKAGIMSVRFGVPATIAENRAQILAIAKAIGRNDAGADLAAKIDHAVQADPPRPGAPSAIIWQSGGFVAGRGTLQDELLTRAGFVNASSVYGLQQWGQLPIETLIRRPPSVIFMPVAAEVGEGGRETATRRRLLRHLPTTRIFDFPDQLLFCGGPAVIKAMDIMRKAR